MLKEQYCASKIFLCNLFNMFKNTVQALKYPSAHAVTICQVSRQLIENKNDLLKLIKPKWPSQPHFQSHMKTDNTNRLADPENLYIYTMFRGNSEKKKF